jgi:outer membrane protein TolC
LWRAWQTSQQARDLYLQISFGERRAAVLSEQADFFLQHYQRYTAALKSADATLDQVSPTLSAYADAQQLLYVEQRNVNKVKDDLAGLLNVNNSIAINISKAPTIPTLQENTIQELLPTAADRRPDLTALRFGYNAEDARVRRAILSQFPSFSIGYARARDTSDLYTNGLTLSMNLPLFNANRGEIAVRRATREQLRRQYQASLNQMETDVLTLFHQYAALSNEIEALTLTSHQLHEIVEEGQEAFNSGDFPALSYVTLVSTYYAQKIALIDRKLTTWQIINSLYTLLGGPQMQSTTTDSLESLNAKEGMK